MYPSAFCASPLVPSAKYILPPLPEPALEPRGDEPDLGLGLPDLGAARDGAHPGEPVGRVAARCGDAEGARAVSRGLRGREVGPCAVWSRAAEEIVLGGATVRR